MAAYFFAWLIVSEVQSDGLYYFTFLTNWAFLTLNLYLLFAALSTTMTFLTVNFPCPGEGISFPEEDNYPIDKKPTGCCGYSDNRIKWYQMIHWVLFTLSTDIAFTVTVLYWTLLYRGGDVGGASANTHLVNGIVAVAEVWISGVPVQLLHFIYPMIYAVVYSVFTGIYFAASGNVVYDNVLDYGEGLGLAVGVVVGVTLVFIPLVHFIFYLQYFAKNWILYRLFHGARVKMSQ